MIKTCLLIKVWSSILNDGYIFVVIIGTFPNARDMFYVFLFTSRSIFKSEGREVNFEESCSSYLNMHVLEESINTVCEGHNCSIYWEIVLASIDVVCYDLQRKTGGRVETILRQEDCTYSFGVFVMADFKGDELFESIDVAINCCIVPPCRYYEFYSSINVVNSVEEMIKFIVETIKFLIRIFIIVQKLRIREFAGIWQSSYVLPTSCKYKKGNRDILEQHRLNKAIEEQFVFGLQ